MKLKNILNDIEFNQDGFEEKLIKVNEIKP